MHITTKRKKRIDVAESGVLSDIAFLLIIFFIVIAVFNVNTGFILGLPRKNSSKIVNVEDIVKARLEQDGSLLYENRRITLDFLENTVVERLKLRPNMTFLLTIHPDTPYQYVVDIVNLVRKDQVENFSFRMETLEQ